LCSQQPAAAALSLLHSAQTLKQRIEHLASPSVSPPAAAAATAAAAAAAAAAATAAAAAATAAAAAAAAANGTPKWSSVTSSCLAARCSPGPSGPGLHRAGGVRRLKRVVLRVGWGAIRPPSQADPNRGIEPLRLRRKAHGEA